MECEAGIMTFKDTLYFRIKWGV